MLASLENAFVFLGSRQILRQVSVTVEEGRRIGVVGPNGAGKTTLLNLLCGELEPDSGEVYRAPDLRLGYLRQNSGLDLGRSIAAELRSVFAELDEAEAQMRRVEAELSGCDPIAEPERYQSLTGEYQRAQTVFEAGDGYTISVRIATVLHGMGFADFDLSMPVANLSGGERTRLALCKLLLMQPDLLVLDEATNHLDFRMLDWLEAYLSAYKGAIVTVSHDRYFLDAVCDEIWELENETVVRYNAGYSKYIALRTERLARLEKEYQRQIEQEEKLRDYIARNLVRASTTKMAQSRRKTLEKMQEAKRPAPPPRMARIRFRYSLAPVKDLLSVEEVTLTAGEKELMTALSFELKRGEKVALIGENGVGKTTLMKLLAGQGVPAAGRIVWGTNARLAYFCQGDGELDLSGRAIDQLWNRYPGLTENELRSLLGGLGLTGEEVFKQTGLLSGGERARLKLGLLMLREGNVLLLDEPSNHLDIWTKQALDEALAAFDGTLVIVSHDRYLLSRIPGRILEMRPEGVLNYPGGFAQYRQSSAPPASAPPPAPKRAEAPVVANEYYRSKKQRSTEAALRHSVREQEEAIHRLEAEQTQLQTALATPQVAADYRQVSEHTERLNALAAELQTRYQHWSTALAELENLQNPKPEGENA